MVSDRSSVGDFFYCDHVHQRDGTPCEDTCVCDFSGQLKQIQERLDVAFEITMDTNLVFIATQLLLGHLSDPENYQWK